MSKGIGTSVKLIHKANADHYRKLLHVQLSDKARSFVEQQLVKEQSALQRRMDRGLTPGGGQQLSADAT